MNGLEQARVELRDSIAAGNTQDQHRLEGAIDALQVVQSGVEQTMEKVKGTSLYPGVALALSVVAGVLEEVKKVQQ